ncbi:uncharacterized protein G2W53_020572 [Senna tora]|uniref:Uncharacterized protein n=1 Tax=Senna tora TaxID=362788 RepID=A0A834TVP7_9FABA|nr:uncharacterized protein G2W53_020572 [Senna tora]
MRSGFWPPISTLNLSYEASQLPYTWVTAFCLPHHAFLYDTMKRRAFFTVSTTSEMGMSAFWATKSTIMPAIMSESSFEWSLEITMDAHVCLFACEDQPSPKIVVLCPGVKLRDIISPSSMSFPINASSYSSSPMSSMSAVVGMLSSRSATVITLRLCPPPKLVDLCHIAKIK